ncbi:MAG: (2Fe-2S)-binding protein, partial [Bullifex sp.]
FIIRPKGTEAFLLLYVKQDPAWGNIICRCEQVSEGEIREAVRRGGTTIDGVKRRVRAGMGRCQGGFCSVKVMEIIARETGTGLSSVRKNETGSEVVG